MNDKEKSLFDSFADTIKHTFDIATEAASKALEPEPLKRDEELVVVPASTDALVANPASPIVTTLKKRNPRKKAAVDTSGRITPDYDIPIPTTPMPSSRKAAKASKAPAKKSAAKKIAKKSKKTPKKSIFKRTAKKQRRSRSAVKKKKTSRGGR